MINDRAILYKKQRFLHGEPLRVVDLFSGAGGMSLGFQAAGYKVLGGIEIDQLSAETHALNFHNESQSIQNLHGKARDIVETEPSDFMSELYPNQDPETMVDVIIGGPPCQAFARVGRAKLREIAEHPEAYKQDERAQLYLRYLRYVMYFKPLLVVMENVPDILNYGGHNIAEDICETLEELGYTCRYTLLNSAHYGVPQMRERFFLVGISKQMGAVPSFPVPTHHLELPQGYAGARRVALKGLTGHNQPSLFEPYKLFQSEFVVFPPHPTLQVPEAVSAEAALHDLPPITVHLEGKLKRGARRFTELALYRNDVTPSEYAILMRTWSGYEGREGVYDHVIRSLPRDYAIFRRMRPGDQYPEAYSHALSLFHEKLDMLQSEGQEIREGTEHYDNLFKSIVPPYDPGKFPNKWRKIERNMPARTLMAHLGKDGYSHIHYDDEQARTISVREAARLQSFPDGFQFVGTMNPAFRQIGNAVPPLLARAIAEHLSETIRNVSGVEQQVVI